MTAPRWRAPAAFDLNDPAVIADPYPTYARIRDPDTFSSDLRGLAKDLRVNPFNPSMRVPRRVAALGARLPWARVLLTSDPPEHTVLRRKISRAFTPRMIAEWESRIRDISEALVDELLAASGTGPIDLVDQLASPLPTTVISEMLGVPSERRDDFKRWSDDLVGGLVSTGSIRRMLTSVTTSSACSSPAKMRALSASVSS